MGRRPARCYRYQKNKPYIKVRIYLLRYQYHGLWSLVWTRWSLQLLSASHTHQTQQTTWFASLTQFSHNRSSHSHATAVVFRSRRSVFLMLVPRRPPLISFLLLPTWCATRSSRFLLRLWKPVVLPSTSTCPRISVKMPSTFVFVPTLSTSYVRIKC